MAAMKLFHLQLLLSLSVLTLWAAAQDTKPASYPWDCRRSNVGCLQSGRCDISNGTCHCQNGTEGHDCGLNTNDKVDPCPNDDNKCENNGKCKTDKTCYCDSDTYGAKCENPRVKMWCSANRMFININPHGTFKGMIYLTKEGGGGKSDNNCVFKTTTDLVLTNYPEVKTAQGAPPTLGGYYLVQQHEPLDNNTESCQAAKKVDSTERTDYEQTVVIVYNTAMTTSVDQKVILNCSISKSAGGPTTSENAMAVNLNSDDLSPVNVTDTIQPVLFEIKTPSGAVITSNVNLGDPLDLVFSMQVQESIILKQFKLTDCTATNGQPTTNTSTNAMPFLENDCPKPGSEMLYRGQVTQDITNTLVKATVPLSAFRFVGTFDAVVFTCSLKLCTQDMLTADPNACTKTQCPGDSTSTPGSGGNETTTVAPGTNTTPGGTNATTVAGTTAAPPATTTAGSTGRRRKRSAEPKTEEQVSKAIQVNSGRDSAQAGTGQEPDQKNEELADCMQHSEVVIIIAIFTVILVLLLLALVILVVNLLRSRQKVVGTPAPSCIDTQSHYTLPRLSLSTTM